MRTSAGAAALGLVGCESEDQLEAERGQGLWGAPRVGGGETLLPADKQPEGVLEFFLFGGVSPWENFYVVPDYNRPEAGGPTAGTMWWAFNNPNQPTTVESQFYGRCDGGNRDVLERPFARANNMDVFLGPFLYPLRERPDIVNRMRMWVMNHGQGAHETGIPLAMTGSLASSPRMAGTPAHVERFRQERQATERRTPWSGVIYPGLPDLSALNGEAMSATGLHRGSARPLSLRLGQDGLAPDGLTRSTVSGKTDQLDRLVRMYTDRWERRLIHAGRGERVRAPAVDDFRSARTSLERADAVLELLGEGAFGGATGQECGDNTIADYTAMSLRTGIRMLTGPEAMRWVTVIDGGLLPATGGATYDTHFFHIEHSSRNLVHSMRELVSYINEPGEDDPNKLDLDRHTIYITTEFGRTPYAIGDGTNHWSEGYVCMAFGGPFDEERAGIVGHIDEEGYAQGGITPTDLRASMLQLQGIWPFTGESFAVADISADTLNEVESATWIREVILGYPLS